MKGLGTTLLEVRDFPMVGADGKRIKPGEFYGFFGSLLPTDPPVHAAVTVGHNDGCSCADGDRSLTACSCDTVHVRLDRIQC